MATDDMTGSGDLTGYVSTVDASAERQRSEVATRESEERLHFALRSANMVAWDWDLPSGRMGRSEDSFDPREGDEGPAHEFFRLGRPEDRSTRDTTIGEEHEHKPTSD